MDILIHGTKGGWKALYPMSDVSEVMYRFASDARRTDSRGNINWHLYSIAFSGQGCIFSKYVGVRDVFRQYGGFIAFSIHIPYSQKMSGNEIKNLLDEMAGRYCNEYVVDGNLNGDVHEDWLLMSSIVTQYENKLRPVPSRKVTTSISGDGEPAYIYYEDDTKLCKYLDAPLQDEYLAYKQVYFIEQQFKDSDESPLYALRHDQQANLTNRIDIDNIKYRLQLPQRQSSNAEADMEVRVNGYIKRNDDKIYRKDTISITYSKRFYETVRCEGKISDPEASQYIVADETVIVQPLSTDKMQPLTKKIQVKVEERSGKPVSEYTITATSRTGMEKRLGQSEYISFTGSELGEQWRIDVETPDGRKDFQEIFPENNDTTVRLQPQKSILVCFTIQDESGVVFPPYTISYKGVPIESKNGEYEFKGEDADSDSDIVVTVSKQGYESKDYKFCPCREPKPYISLKKSTTPPTNNKKSYYFEVDQDIATVYPSYINEKEKVDQVQPELKKKGYRFVKWEGPTKDKRKHPEYDGYYKAVFEEVWWHKFRWYLIVAATVILVALLILLVRFIIPTPDTNTSYGYTNVEDSIKTCNNDTAALNALKDRWESRMPEIAQTGGFLGFGSKADSTGYNWWEKGLESINDAINKSKSASTSQAPSNNSTTETTESPVTNGQTSSPVQGENTKPQEIRNNICNEFWELYNNNRNEQDPEWNNLYNKFKTYKNNAYVKFLHKITYNGTAFSNFKALEELPSNERDDDGLKKLDKQFDNKSNEGNNATKMKEDAAKGEFFKLIKKRGIKAVDLNKFKNDEKYKGTTYATYLDNIDNNMDKFIDYLKEHKNEVKDINDLGMLQAKFNEYLKDNK